MKRENAARNVIGNIVIAIVLLKEDRKAYSNYSDNAHTGDATNLASIDCMEVRILSFMVQNLIV